MRYLLITGIYPPDIGGPATYIPRLAQFISSTANQVTVISLRNKESEVIREGEWRCLFIPRNISKLVRIPLTILAIKRQSIKCDRIFANGLYTECAVATLFSKKPKIAKVVGDPVWERYQNRTDDGESISNFKAEGKGPSIWFQRKLFTWTLNRFDVVTCPSQGLAKLLQEWQIKSRVVVVENGVQCTQPVEKIEKYDVISLSRLVKWKNIDSLIRALSGSNLRLAIAGEGPEKVNLKKLAKKCNVDVEFLGQIPQDEVPKLMASAKIFTLLSDYEGLSFSLIQAMMEKCSIIVSSAEGNIAVINHGINGLIVNPSDTGEIRNAIDFLLNNHQMASRFATEARRAAQSYYCEEIQLGKMVNLFDQAGKKN